MDFQENWIIKDIYYTKWYGLVHAVYAIIEYKINFVLILYKDVSLGKSPTPRNV